MIQSLLGVVSGLRQEMAALKSRKRKALPSEPVRKSKRLRAGQEVLSSAYGHDSQDEEEEDDSPSGLSEVLEGSE